jgi:A/G-specific adenine glycosylase
VLFPQASNGVEARIYAKPRASVRRSRRLDELNVIVDPLLQWGLPQLRDFPWRATRNRWHVLVSEVMSQQTQIDRVVPKFQAFIEAFPTPRECADAPLSELLTIWQGLGYPRRCRNLHEAAKLMVCDHHSQVPADLELLLALPGIGEYTARAVLAFAEHADVGVVDTNVTRVFARVLNKPLGKRETQTIADSTVPVGLSWEWNQVLMDFGATCCVARSPKCDQCPIETSCGWRLHGGDDPAPASAGTSKPQARFVGSNRQARGKLLKVLVAGGVMRNKAEYAMGLVQQPDRAEMIIESLLADHLIIDVNGMLQLPL